MTPATTRLAESGVPHTVHSYDHDPATTDYGDEAAQALGVDAARVFKTLCVEVGGALCVAVVPVTSRLDLKAAAQALGTKKATMAEPARAEKTTGYVLGGISPLGQRRALRTVIDETALDWASIYVSAGRRGLEIELAPTDLIALTQARTAPLRR